MTSAKRFASSFNSEKQLGTAIGNALENSPRNIGPKTKMLNNLFDTVPNHKTDEGYEAIIQNYTEARTRIKVI